MNSLVSYSKLDFSQKIKTLNSDYPNFEVSISLLLREHKKISKDNEGYLFDLASRFFAQLFSPIVTPLKIEEESFFTATLYSKIRIKIKTTFSAEPIWTITPNEINKFQLIAFFSVDTHEHEVGKITFAGYLDADDLTEEQHSLSMEDFSPPSTFEEHLEHLVRLERKDFTAIALSCLQLGKTDEALDFFSMAAEKEPHNFFNYWQKASIYFDRQQYLAVVPLVSIAIQLAPLKDFLYILRAKTLFQLQDYEGAFLDATTAIRMNPLNPFCYYSRAQILFDSGYYTEAIDDYTAAIRLNPNDAYAFYSRGKIRSYLRHHQLAMEDFDRATKVDINALIPRRALSTMTFEVTSLGLSGHYQRKSTRSANYFSLELDSIKKINLKMVFIPGGTFFIGSSDQEIDREHCEGPQTQILIPPFFMGKYPITQAQWAIVAGFPKIDCHLREKPSEFRGARLPVENISWYEAVEFCARLSKYTGSFYRLPSESEWEYACRAQTTTPFYSGETITTDLANYDGKYPYGFCQKGSYRGQTSPVGTFPPNAFGLYDMHGNVREWCADSWQDNYKGISLHGFPTESNDSLVFRLTRGGSWYHPASRARSAHRKPFSPDSRVGYLGLRVVRGDSLLQEKET